MNDPSGELASWRANALSLMQTLAERTQELADVKANRDYWQRTATFLRDTMKAESRPGTATVVVDVGMPIGPDTVWPNPPSLLPGGPHA